MMRLDAGFRPQPGLAFSDLELFILRGTVRIGCIALGRTDGELVNCLPYDPWSTADENTARAAAFVYRKGPQLRDWTVNEGRDHPDGSPDFGLVPPA